MLKSIIKEALIWFVLIFIGAVLVMVMKAFGAEDKTIIWVLAIILMWYLFPIVYRIASK